MAGYVRTQGENLERNIWYCDGTADDVQIQAAINNVVTNGGGKIELSAGTFNLTAGTGLTIPAVASNKELLIIGEGYFSTTVEGDAAKLLDYSGTSSSPYCHVTLKDLGFQHTTDQSSDITIDGSYLNALNLDTVRLINMAGTKQGTAVKVLPHTIGFNPVWKQAVALNYGLGFDIGYDHLLGKNLITSGCTDSYYIHDASEIYHVGLINPHAYQLGLTSGITFRFLNAHGCSVLYPTVEGGSGGTMFQHDGGGSQVYLLGLKNIGSTFAVMSAANRKRFFSIQENLKSWIVPFTVSAGVTNQFIARIPNHISKEDVPFIRRICVYLEQAPATSQSLTVQCYDGSNVMRASVIESAVTNYSRCEDDLAINLTSDASIGDNHVHVSSTDIVKVAVGDTVTVQDTGNSESKTISALLADGTMTFSANLTFGYTVVNGAHVDRTASAWRWDGYSTTGYLLLRYTSTAGCATGDGTIAIVYSELPLYT